MNINNEKIYLSNLKKEQNDIYKFCAFLAISIVVLYIFVNKYIVLNNNKDRQNHTISEKNSQNNSKETNKNQSNDPQNNNIAQKEKIETLGDFIKNNTTDYGEISQINLQNRLKIQHTIWKADPKFQKDLAITELKNEFNQQAFCKTNKIDFSHFRPIRGDGNCYFNSFILSLFDNFILNYQQIDIVRYLIYLMQKKKPQIIQQLQIYKQVQTKKEKEFKKQYISINATYSDEYLENYYNYTIESLQIILHLIPKIYENTNKDFKIIKKVYEYFIYNMKYNYMFFNVIITSLRVIGNKCYDYGDQFTLEKLSLLSSEIYLPSYLLNKSSGFTNENSNSIFLLFSNDEEVSYPQNMCKHTELVYTKKFFDSLDDEIKKIFLGNNQEINNLYNQDGVNGILKLEQDIQNLINQEKSEKN